MLRQAFKGGGVSPQTIMTSYLLDVPTDHVDARRFVTLVADGREQLGAGELAEVSLTGATTCSPPMSG